MWPERREKHYAVFEAGVAPGMKINAVIGRRLGRASQEIQTVEAGDLVGLGEGRVVEDGVEVPHIQPAGGRAREGDAAKARLPSRSTSSPVG